MLAGESGHFELPVGVDGPRLNSVGTDVYGCGLLLDPEEKLAIFFPLNCQILAIKVMPNNIPIFTTVHFHFFSNAGQSQSEKIFGVVLGRLPLIKIRINFKQKDARRNKNKEIIKFYTHSIYTFKKKTSGY
jgi:hypothetical protein